MKILKFEGATMRDAIAKVKAELGDHAVIVATRQIRRGLLGTGYEISAAIDPETDDRDDGNANGPTRGGPMASAITSLGRNASAYQQQAHAVEPDVEKLIAPLRSEIRSLRALVRAEFKSATKLPAAHAAVKAAPPPIVSKAAHIVSTSQAASLIKAKAEELVAPSKASAIALVGPTGAGKTTTIAKLAARAALIEQRQVQLVTLDNYRVGGVDQIRTFAELIGVPLHVAPNAAEMHDLLADPNVLTLIDTAGRSPRDVSATAELADQLRAFGQIEIHLVATASTSPAALDALANRYCVLGPSRLLITKLDEVDSAPDLARAPGRLNLPITWVTTGQAVPEDIEEPTTARVLELAARGLVAGRAA